MLAHLVAGCVIAFAAIPDIVVPGYRRIAVSLQIEAGPLLDHCCVQHITRKGDTLSRIATAHCGTVTALKDILALNPGIKPDHLAIGQRIWLPPRLEAARKQPPTFVFHSQNWPLAGGGSPFAPMAQTTPPRYGKMALLVVPEDQMKAFQEARRKWQSIDMLVRDKQIQKIEAACGGGNVPDHDPTHKCDYTVTIQRSDKGIYSAAVKSVSYDKKGKVIEPATIQKQPSRDMWLLLLPIGGAGWLALRARRRRAALVAAAV